MNIFIVGPMGSGKSTVGKIISDELFMTFLDTDEEIESRTGASIDWIFDLEGESGFRKRESEILSEMVDKNSVVLSTGGGIILSDQNRELLSSRGTVFYLATPISVQLERTAKDKDRPLLLSGGIFSNVVVNGLLNKYKKICKRQLVVNKKKNII